jgi:chorismate mutase
MQANTKLSKKQKTAGAAASAKKKSGRPPITVTTRNKTVVAAATAKQFTPNAIGQSITSLWQTQQVRGALGVTA